MEKIDLIQHINGNFGKFQLRAIAIIFLSKFPAAWFMAVIIFTAPAARHAEYFCKPNFNSVKWMNESSWELSVIRNKSEWIKILHPLKEAGQKEFKIDFCNAYDDVENHAENYFNNLTNSTWTQSIEKRNSSVKPCTNFMHHTSHKSLITDYDLVCSRDILVTVTQFFHLLGVLSGGFIAVCLLEFVSPKAVLYIGVIVQLFCGNLTGHVTKYELHCFFRCLAGGSAAHIYTAGQVIYMDLTAGLPRTLTNSSFEIFWSIGVIVLPAVASYLDSWSFMYTAISCPTAIYLLLFNWLPNSPRWLLAHGHVEEVKEILMESARVNNRMHLIPPDFDNLLEQQCKRVQTQPRPASWWSLWKGPRAGRKTVCIHIVWAIYIVSYYGMLLNIRSFGREYLRINTVVAGCSEIIGLLIGMFFIIFTTNKWIYAGLFNIFAGGIAYVAWAVEFSDLEGNGRVAAYMICAMSTKAAVSCTLVLISVCTGELVPESKKKALGISTVTWARFWLLGAPFVGVLAIFYRSLPLSVFAALNIIGGVFTCFLRSGRTVSFSSKGDTTTTGIATSINLAGAGGIAQMSEKKSIDNDDDLNSPRIWTISGSQQQQPTQQQQDHKIISNLTTEELRTPRIWRLNSHDEKIKL